MSFYKNKNVLVTGAAGLNGHSAIPRLLSEGAYVRATTYINRKLKINHPNLEIVSCDLMDINQCYNVCKDMDIVINFLAKTMGANRSKSPAGETARYNLIPNINIMEAAVNSKIDKFGFVGSSTAYPDVNYPIKEEEMYVGDPCKSYMEIGWVYRYLEKVATNFHNTTNTKFAIIRTTALYGPNDMFKKNGHGHVIPDFIMKISNKPENFEIWGDGSQIRDFLYVDDLVDGLLLTIEKHAKADPINIATGVPTSITKLINVISNAYGYTPIIEYDKTKPTMIPYRMVDIEKAKNILGWKYSIPLEEGIKKTIEWYNKQ